MLVNREPVCISVGKLNACQERSFSVAVFNTLDTNAVLNWNCR
jgi:hypothetical protein